MKKDKTNVSLPTGEISISTQILKQRYVLGENYLDPSQISAIQDILYSKFQTTDVNKILSIISQEQLSKIVETELENELKIYHLL